jgi:hypothetical protein
MGENYPRDKPTDCPVSALIVTHTKSLGELRWQTMPGLTTLVWRITRVFCFEPCT